MELSSISIKDVMSRNVAFVNKDDQISEIISRMSNERITELPVVDNGLAVGIVTYNTLLKKRHFPLTSKADIIMQHFPHISELDPLTKGIEVMINLSLRDLPVVRNGKLVGTVYEKDVMEILAKVKGLRTRPVTDLMTPAPENVRDTDDVRKALSIMRGLDEKNLPVLDKEGRLVGVIGMMDIMKATWKPKKAQKKEFKSDNKPVEVIVSSIMNKPAICVSPENLVEDALRKMIRRDISTIFVTENSKLTGVLTLKDILEQAMSMEKREEGVFVQLTGLQVEDPDIYDSIYSIIQKGLIRTAKFATPRLFNAHVVTYNHQGLRSKYSVHARLTTDKSMYFAKTSDWDLFKAMNDSLEVLEKEIKKERDKDLTMRKRGSK